MNRKKILKFSVFFLLVIGMSFLIMSLAGSFLPSNKAIADIPRLDLSKIKKGQYKYLPHPIYGSERGFTWGILVYRKSDGTIKMWNVPLSGQHGVGMPDRQWWHPSEVCKNFSPTMIDNRIDENQPIKCHDSKLSAERWQWSIDGKSLDSSGMLQDLVKTQGFIQGNEFVFLK